MRSFTASPVQEEIEMQPINTRRARPAISGQTVLQPLQLGEGAANLSSPPRRTRFTDAEMIDAEAGWGAAERAAGGRESHHTRHISNPLRSLRIERTQNRLSRPAGFEIAQQDGSTAIIQDGRAGLLMSVEEGRNLRNSMEQKQLSRKYFWASAVTPLSAIAFGCGFFDRRIARRTDGRITEMDRDDKWQALYFLAPTSAVLWAALIVLLLLAVARVTGRM